MSLLVVLVTQASSLPRNDIIEPYLKKPTTVLVYFVETKNSARYLDSLLHEMQKNGSNENMNALVYTASTNALGTVARALVVERGQTFQDGKDVNKDGRWPQTVLDACVWAHETFPSDNFVFFFCSHGSGPLTGTSFNEQDLREALDYLVNVRNKPIDVVAFDVDLMATVEVAYAVQPYANYLVASEALILGDRFPYASVLKYAAKWRSYFSAYKIVFDMVKEYENGCEEIIAGYTLSAIDLSKVVNLYNALTATTNRLRYLLSSQDKTIIYQKLGESGNPDECTYFAQTNYADLGHFLNNLSVNFARLRVANTQILTQLMKDILGARRALSGCVVACAQGEDHPNANGLAFKYDFFHDPFRRT